MTDRRPERKRIVLCGALVAALAIPAAALGARTVYVGDLDDQGSASVKLKTTGSGDRTGVSAFTVKAFEVRCDDGTRGVMRRATLRGRVPIGRRGGFHVRDDNGDTEFNLRGRIARNKVSGRFRFSGEMDVVGGPVLECDSGRESWTVRRR